MSDALNEFQSGTANWRKTLKQNKSRTRYVIATFILIYICIGLLIDMYWQSGHYPTATLSQLFVALVTLQITPVATLIAGAVAAISIWVSFRMHDKLMLLGTEYVEVKSGDAGSNEERQLYNVVEEMKVAAGLQYMPRIFIINADYMNAFASGYSEKSAMVAITRGLMQKLDRDELQAVMAHELSHIRHMDIKLTLFASVLSNITLMAIDILFFSVLFGGRSNSNDSEGGGARNILFIVVIILRYALPLITVLLMLYLSRTREYMADAGSVELMRDNEPMARALLKISGDHQQNKEQYAQAYAATPHEQVRRESYIFDPMKAGIEAKSAISDMYSTHPGISKRLAAIGFRKQTSEPER